MQILIILREIVRLVSKQSLLFCSGIVLLMAVHLAAQSPQLERLGAAEGLSQGMIFDLLQDRNGFLWFATKDGLNRYDGYSFQAFQNDPFDRFSIPDNEIQVLLEDNQGRIWAGTANNGITILEPGSGRFYRLNTLYSQSVHCLAQTPDGAIWAGSGSRANRVLVPDVLPPNNPILDGIAQVDTFNWNPKPNAALPTLTRLVDLFCDQEGRLWVSTYQQIGYYDTRTSVFEKVWTNPLPEGNDLSSSYFQQGPDGSIWVGQPGQLLRVQERNVQVYPLPEHSPFPQTDLAFDAAGNLFVSTRKQVFKANGRQLDNRNTLKFELFYRFPDAGIMGSTKMLIDRGGLLWIGTNGYGLLKHNPGNPQFHHLLKGKSPRRIVTDTFGRVWVWQAGGVFEQLLEHENKLGPLLCSDPSILQHDCIQTTDGDIWILCENKLKNQSNGCLVQLDGPTLQLKAKHPLYFSLGMFSRLFQSPDGTLWILGDKSVLAKFDPKTKKTATFDFSQYTGFQELALSLCMDVSGQLWIGTPHGLLQATPEAGQMKFTLHKNNPDNRSSLNCNSVLALFNDPEQPAKYLWIGTKGGGLNRLDKQSKEVRHFTMAEGLPNNVVYAILPDSEGALWLSTNRGLSKFNPKTGEFQNFFSVDGLQDNEFNTVSYAIAADKRLYFGGVNGITAFYPEALKASTKSPPVLLTRLRVNDQFASVSNGLLEKSLEATQSITLHHLQNQLSFEFAAMDFSAPRMNQFRYRLVGADKNWVESTTTNSATYANLGPGRYVFEVVTGGSRGIWDGPPLRLEIKILPPWWRSTWAYFLWATLTLLGIWLFYRFQTNKIRLENKLAFEQHEATRLAELDRLKTNFFSSITHEFRTPLSLLLEPARQLLAEAKDQTQRYRLELIDNNARRLLQFVNQLLDLSKLEAGQMPLDLRPGNPVSSLRAVVERFQALAQQNSIQVDLELPDKPVQVIFDETKWDQVLSNLLSNALKFTDSGGRVLLKLVAEKAAVSSHVNLKLAVSDTGIGISAADLPQVFSRFYQTEHTRGGTGIGLSLCKELVERMGGSIAVESEPGKGTTFLVSLTCEIAKIQYSEPSERIPSSPRPAPSAVNPQPLTVNPQPLTVNHPPSTAPLLLLIEDDTELRQFLRASLPASYRIAEAADGAEGIQMALELVPDLVISDLMMPHKNGYEVAETLKNDSSTSHIPLILLSAKSALESKMQGLQRGADVYLTKPFQSDELVAHIENLLSTRQRLQTHFAQSVSNGSLVESVVATLPAEENEFLQRLIEVVEANLDNEAMDADAFARAVFISRSQLHRKISALTGLSLSEFVRNHRLDRARDMLIQREGSISEIAWRTGFPNAKYFSTCFKERFGKTPSGVAAGD